ncbi:hypothetical protein L204_104138 [Cryptococcus depauperatus]
MGFSPSRAVSRTLLHPHVAWQSLRTPPSHQGGPAPHPSVQQTAAVADRARRRPGEYMGLVDRLSWERYPEDGTSRLSQCDLDNLLHPALYPPAHLSHSHACFVHPSPPAHVCAHRRDCLGPLCVSVVVPVGLVSVRVPHPVQCGVGACTQHSVAALESFVQNALPFPHPALPHTLLSTPLSAQRPL